MHLMQNQNPQQKVQTDTSPSLHSSANIFVEIWKYKIVHKLFQRVLLK